MIKNYFKLAWRNISRHKFYAAVNVIGLFAGITFVLLIGAYVWSEKSVNKNLRHASQQYFLQSEWNGDAVNYGITTIAPLARRLKEDYPQLVSNYYRWDGITSGISYGDKIFREGIQLGDSTLLSMYGFELLHGNSATALQQPYSVVITEATAVKYFGKTDVVGESLTIQNFSGGKKEFAVTGVLKNIPKNSVTNLNESNNNTIFIPTNTSNYFGRADMESWTNTGVPAYIELKEGATLAALNTAIDHLMQANAPENIRTALKIVPVPLTEYYVQKDNGLVSRMMYTLSLVALFILLMAIVNFINITISSAGNRMREIGVRKVLGGLKKQLVMQFLAESLLLVLIATVLAIMAYPLARPYFMSIVGREIPALMAFPVYFAAIPLLMVVVVGVLAGAYPAFVLSAVSTLHSLRGKLKTVKENVLLRKSLVGFQFAMALVVLVAATVVTQQVGYFFSRNLGYNKEYIVTAQVPRDWSVTGVQKMETVRNEFARMPEVSSVSLSYEIPNGNNGGDQPLFKLGSDSTKAIRTQVLLTDEHYLDTYQIPLKAGEFFDNRNFDSAKLVINENAALALGYKNATEAIGQQVRMPGQPIVFTIKGVVNDFHFFSMQDAMSPVMFINVGVVPNYRYLSFKVKPGNAAESIAALQKKWAALLPGSAFDYNFMDDTLKKLYATELQLKKAAYAAAFLSLIIVLLGVLGLVSLSIHKRVKEIGVRKVLGASAINIAGLFLSEFIVVIIIAGAVACPVAWYVMTHWLNNYAYRVSLTPLPFVIAISSLAIVTTVLIALQTFKAGAANPVKSLRTE